MQIYLISHKLRTILLEKNNKAILYVGNMKSQLQTHMTRGSPTCSDGKHLEVMAFFSEEHIY